MHRLVVRVRPETIADLQREAMKITAQTGRLISVGEAARRRIEQPIAIITPQATQKRDEPPAGVGGSSQELVSS